MDYRSIAYFTCKQFFLLMGILFANFFNVFSQRADFSYLLPFEKNYLVHKVRRVTFVDKLDGSRFIHEYDRKGRLVKLIENEDPEMVTQYSYSVSDGHEFCKVFRDTQPDNYESYVLEYDNGKRLSVLYQITMFPSYFPADTGLAQSTIDKDSVRVLRFGMSYRDNECIIISAGAVSALAPQSVLQKLKTLNYHIRDTEIVKTDSTADHCFTTTFDSHREVVHSDSIFYQDGKIRKAIVFANMVYWGEGRSKNFRILKEYAPVPDGNRMVTTTTYINEQGKLVKKKSVSLIVENEKGLETEFYDWNEKGKKTLQRSTQYEYY